MCDMQKRTTYGERTRIPTDGRMAGILRLKERLRDACELARHATCCKESPASFQRSNDRSVLHQIGSRRCRPCGAENRCASSNFYRRSRELRHENAAEIIKAN